jgi:beta-phosphoglucomutase-like phosphatase (HAD superfamily)
MRQRLSNAGILHRLNSIISCEDVEREKPNPDLLVRAAGALGLDPEVCFALDESHNGIASAYAAGCKVVMVQDLLGQPRILVRSRSDCQRPKGSVAAASSSGQVAV